MSDDFDDYTEDEEDDDDYGCDYSVSEFCSEPETKAMGLCTTECAAYFKAVEEDDKPRETEEEKRK